MKSLVRTIGYLLDGEVADPINKVDIIRLDGLLITLPRHAVICQSVVEV